MMMIKKKKIIFNQIYNNKGVMWVSGGMGEMVKISYICMEKDV